MKDTSQPVPDPADCGELRRRVDVACAGVAALRAAALAAADTLSRTRASVADAESRLAAAQHTADPGAIAEAKAQARRIYRRDYGTAATDHERQMAATAWLREVDRINRDARAAARTVESTRRELSEIESTVPIVTQAADAARIRSETVADACRSARERLATCEEHDLRDSMPVDTGAASQSRASRAGLLPTAGDDDDEPTAPPRPLVIQRLAEGDRRALRAVSADLAEATGQEPTVFVLLLQELVDAISAVAAGEGFLDFGEDHPFWSQFSRDEVRSVVRALAGMGCRYDPRDGFAGRAPGWNEFSLAMAHAGYDLRGVRGVPQAAGFAKLFEGAHAAVDELLNERAPQLTLEQITAVLGPAADGLGDLWDNWGRLRPQLLAESAG